MAGRLALFVGRPHTDNGIATKDTGFIGGCLCFKNSLPYGIRVMAVNVGDHMPAVGIEALRYVFGKPAVYFTIN